MPVLGRVEEKEWAAVEYSLHHSKAHLPAGYQKAVLPSGSPLLLPHACALALRLPAILEG